MAVRLGYACISIPMRERGVYTGRTLMLKSLRERGIEAARELARQNVRDLRELIEYNERIGIRFFRVTSDLFPHMDNPALESISDEIYNIDFIRGDLVACGQLARSYGHRLTMHPGQFAQLGSPRPEVVAQTGRDLGTHAAIFAAMGLEPSHGSVMIIHGGGTFGDKAASAARFRANFAALPEDTRKYISLENDEFQWSVRDLLPICEDLGIPLCVDYFHHSCRDYRDFDIFDPDLIHRVMRTWHRRGIKPKCHWSGQAPGKRVGTHADCVDEIPPKLLAVCKQYDCDIMIEAKKKDECVIGLLNKYYTRVNSGGKITWSIN